MFSGLLYCADCGEKLYYSVTNNYKAGASLLLLFCRTVRTPMSARLTISVKKSWSNLCLRVCRGYCGMYRVAKKLFAQRQLEEFGEKQKKELAEKRRELDKAKLRVREIDGIIQKLYEDNATGKISDERFATMSVSLENEQSELKTVFPLWRMSLRTQKSKPKAYSGSLTKQSRLPVWNPSRPELVHEFIEKIVVSAPEYKDGKRYQEVAIYYNGVGIIREPTAEEMEEYFQEHISRKSHS